MTKKREPVVIDVRPDELHREPAGEAVPRHMIEAGPRQLPTGRLTARQARELHKLGRLAQQPDFWIGLIIRNLWRG